MNDWRPLLSEHDHENLRRAEALWQRLRTPEAPPQVLADGPVGSPDFDVIVLGGTLGIMLAAALACRGWRVALVERGQLRGRAQEWNVSRPELEVLVAEGLLSPEQLEQAIASRSRAARVVFAGRQVSVSGVLDVGVDPVYLLQVLKERFVGAGGQLFEKTPFERAIVHRDGVQVQAGSLGLAGRLVVDAMGHFSPIVRQVRGGAQPDGVCLVVGGCATGFPATDDTADLITSFTPIRNQCQYLWEAFPARDGRTTYLFTYLDADPRRFGFETLAGEYFRLLPAYQGVDPARLQWRQVLFGLFPAYRQPLDLTGWDRILAVGDSAGNQSPLSFGGFGAMLRHLGRLTNGIDAALAQECLSASDLALLQPYQPNLAVTWLFQEAMRVGIDEKVDPQAVNALLATVFTEMEKLGDWALRPFLQDVVRLEALAATLARMALREPGLVLRLAARLGLPSLLAWSGHFAALATYTLLDRLAPPVPGNPYRSARLREAWRYGSGRDGQNAH